MPASDIAVEGGNTRLQARPICKTIVYAAIRRLFLNRRRPLLPPCGHHAVTTSKAPSSRLPAISSSPRGRVSNARKGRRLPAPLRHLPLTSTLAAPEKDPFRLRGRPLRNNGTSPSRYRPHRYAPISSRDIPLYPVSLASSACLTSLRRVPEVSLFWRLRSRPRCNVRLQRALYGRYRRLLICVSLQDIHSRYCSASCIAPRSAVAGRAFSVC